MALTPGTKLGEYEIRAPLGAGGMGEVYRAYDPRLHREVAIKVLPESVSSNPDRLGRFEQEARAAAALNHPNILAVYQMATENGVAYIVSELLEGETVRERLRHGPIPLRKAVDYAVQIARGLASPHEKGIVHRDLKPENLFITNDGRVKILDFGLARVTHPKETTTFDATMTQNTDPGVLIGTAGYMSPEQVRGKPADHRSDIFAFGTILYEMVTGKQTFHKGTSAETMAAILNEDPPSISQIIPTVPPGLQRIVHRCLEKNPEQRFQSASDLAFALEALSDSAIQPLSGVRAEPKGGRRLHLAITGVVLLVAVAVAAISYFWFKPPTTLKITKYTQLTYDGGPKGIVGADGSRLYLAIFNKDYQGMAEMAMTGGEIRHLPILTSLDMGPLSLSADGTQVLAILGQGIPPRGRFWSVPILGGSARPLGDVVGTTAAWSPDGKWLAYTNNNDLLVAKADGSESRKLLTQPNVAVVFFPVWSPDSKKLRFSAGSNPNGPTSIWEVDREGSRAHRLLPGWSDPRDQECCGIWTPDGKYFFFRARGQLWVLPAKTGLFQPEPKPFQLTSSPLGLSSLVFGKDSKKLFLVGQTARGELNRYDKKTKQFVPYLGGISAEYASFSKDGQWVAYVSFPDGTLWRSKVDGSERVQLSYPPGYAMMPRWSPDGKKIAFYETFTDKPCRMYEIAFEGGTAHEFLPEDQTCQQDPNWSPDGSKIVFGGQSGNREAVIRVLDLNTHQVTTLPDSKGLFSPRWSPDGRYIPAYTWDLTRLMVFDMQTQKWREVAQGTLGWMNWTHNGNSLQMLDTNGKGTVIEIRLSDGKTERVTSLDDFRMEGRYQNSMATAPDDSPLLLRNLGTQDVYALDLEEQQ